MATLLVIGTAFIVCRAGSRARLKGGKLGSWPGASTKNSKKICHLLLSLRYWWIQYSTHTHTHTHASTHARTRARARLTTLCPGLPRWAGTRKVKSIWILLKQETVSGSGISWAICKSAPCSRQITTPAPHRSVFYRPDALPATQPTASKHWTEHKTQTQILNLYKKAHKN